jgi:predicted DNA-binding transcriptional regulator AlpA
MRGTARKAFRHCRGQEKNVSPFFAICRCGNVGACRELLGSRAITRSRVRGKTELATATKPVQVPPKSVPTEQRSRLLNAEDIAEITGLSVETLAQWRSQCKGIPFVKLSRNCVRYRQQDLDRWLDERIVRVEQDPSLARRNN